MIGEFVSGNYFRTFGLKARAGRLLSDADDREGAPIAAVMSYETWTNNYAGDPAVVGATFFVNTKPVTIAGIAPEGFYGDRMSSTPPDFYLPIESMPVLANVAYVHDPERQVALHDRSRETGRVAAPAAGEAEWAAAAGARAHPHLFVGENKKQSCRLYTWCLCRAAPVSRPCRKNMLRICTC